MLERFVAAEGNPEAVQLSGGEPTIHPQILEMVEAATRAGIRHVMVNTNGIRLARDPDFASQLAARGAHVYLQFDGFAAETHLALRGRDLRRDKERALEHCAEAGLSVTLVAAVERGLNEHEVGDIVRFGVRHPAVNSVVFQPVTHAGRHRPFDPLTRLTNPDVMGMIAAQVPEWFRQTDFVPVPCCFPTCRSITYALVDGDEVLPLPRLVDVESHLDYVSNRMLPDFSIRASLEKLWSASAVPARSAWPRIGSARPARSTCRPRWVSSPSRVHAGGAGLPGCLHPERAPADEVLRRAADAGRSPDPVLRLQHGRLPRTGPRASSTHTTVETTVPQTRYHCNRRSNVGAHGAMRWNPR